MTAIRFEFIDKHEAAALLKVHPGTLNRYRQEGKLIEGVHYTRLSSQTIRYNKALLEDWVINRDDPAAHRRAIACEVERLSWTLEQTRSFLQQTYSKPHRELLTDEELFDLLSRLETAL